MVPPEGNDPTGSKWIVRRIFLVFVILLLILVPIVIYMVIGFSLLQSIVRGFMIGFGSMTIATALSEILIPKSFLRWRAWMMEGSPKSAALIGSSFDRVIIRSNRDEESQKNYRTIRLIGFVLIVLAASFEIVLWWIVTSAGVR